MKLFDYSKVIVPIIARITTQRDGFRPLLYPDMEGVPKRRPTPDITVGLSSTAARKLHTLFVVRARARRDLPRHFEKPREFVSGDPYDFEVRQSKLLFGFPLPEGRQIVPSSGRRLCKIRGFKAHLWGESACV